MIGKILMAEDYGLAKAAGSVLQREDFDSEAYKLGEGSYGMVYGLDIGGKEYAVKVGLAKGAVRKSEYRKLQIMSGSGVTPDPVAFYGAPESGGSEAILMEYIEGKTVENLVFDLFENPELVCKYDKHKLLESLVNVEREFKKRRLTLPMDSYVASNFIVTPESKIVVVDLDRSYPYSLFKTKELAEEKSRRFAESARDTINCLLHLL